MSSPKLVALGSVATYTPLSNNLSDDPTIQSIQAALAGGPATQQYFQKVNNFGQLFAQLSQNGSAAWTEGTDSSIQYDGQPAPVMYVDLVDGSGNAYYIKVAAANITTDDAGNVNPNSSTQTVNGTVYNGIGTIDMTVGYSNYQYSTTSWWLGTSIAGLVVASKVLPIVFKAVKAAAQTLADKIKATADTPDAGEGGEELEQTEETQDEGGYTSFSDQTGVDVEILEGTAEESAIAMSDVFIGVGIVLAVVFIVLSFVLHSTYQSLRLWNLTKYTLNWSLWFAHGDLVKGPVVFNDDNSIKTYEPLLPVSFGAPIHGVDPTNSAYYADMNYMSSSEWTAIGYVLTATLVDANGNTQYTVSIAYDMPWAGDNKIKLSMDPNIKPSDLYSSIGDNDINTTVGIASNDQKILTTATFDFVNGEHTVPSTNQSTDLQYFYQSLVLIEETDLVSPSSPLPRTTPITLSHPGPMPSNMLRGLKPSLQRKVRNALIRSKVKN